MLADVIPRSRREIFLLAGNLVSSARILLACRPQVEILVKNLPARRRRQLASLAERSTDMCRTTDNTYKTFHTYITCLMLHMGTVGNEILFNSIYSFLLNMQPLPELEFGTSVEVPEGKTCLSSALKSVQSVGTSRSVLL